MANGWSSLNSAGSFETIDDVVSVESISLTSFLSEFKFYYWSFPPVLVAEDVKDDYSEDDVLVEVKVDEVLTLHFLPSPFLSMIGDDEESSCLSLISEPPKTSLEGTVVPEFPSDDDDSSDDISKVFDWLYYSEFLTLLSLFITCSAGVGD